MYAIGFTSLQVLDTIPQLLQYRQYFWFCFLYDNGLHGSHVLIGTFFCLFASGEPIYATIQGSIILVSNLRAYIGTLSMPYGWLFLDYYMYGQTMKQKGMCFYVYRLSRNFQILLTRVSKIYCQSFSHVSGIFSKEFSKAQAPLISTFTEMPGQYYIQWGINRIKIELYTAALDPVLFTITLVLIGLFVSAELEVADLQNQTEALQKQNEELAKQLYDCQTNCTAVTKELQEIIDDLEQRVKEIEKFIK